MGSSFHWVEDTDRISFQLVFQYCPDVFIHLSRKACSEIRSSLTCSRLGLPRRSSALKLYIFKPHDCCNRARGLRQSRWKGIFRHCFHHNSHVNAGAKSEGDFQKNNFFITFVLLTILLCCRAALFFFPLLLQSSWTVLVDEDPCIAPTADNHQQGI